MITDFLTNTWTITKTTSILSWWEQVKTVEEVYIDIPLHFYRNSENLDETDLAEKTKNSSYKAILEPWKTDVRVWMNITINDTALWEIWKFLITWVKMNRLLWWIDDHIELKIKSI